ncbi:hypothetical protein WDU94_009880 [Cyamophila willieti]
MNSNRKGIVNSLKSRVLSINSHNIQQALEHLGLSIAEVVTLDCYHKYFESICAFLGVRICKDKLLHVHVTCKRNFHALHLAEGSAVCNPLYCASNALPPSDEVSPLVPVARYSPVSAEATTSAQSGKCHDNSSELKFQHPSNVNVASASNFFFTTENEKFIIHPILGDGNCLFRAISLRLFGTEEQHLIVRQQTVNYVEKEWHEFGSFIPVPPGSNSSTVASAYCASMRRPSTYGTEIELMAIAKSYNVSISVYRSETAGKSSYSDDRTYTKQQIDLLYSGPLDRGHYELLTPVPSPSQNPSTYVGPLPTKKRKADSLPSTKKRGHYEQLTSVPSPSQYSSTNVGPLPTKKRKADSLPSTKNSSEATSELLVNVSSAACAGYKSLTEWLKTTKTQQNSTNIVPTGTGSSHSPVKLTSEPPLHINSSVCSLTRSPEPTILPSEVVENNSAKVGKKKTTTSYKCPNPGKYKYLITGTIDQATWDKIYDPNFKRFIPRIYTSPVSKAVMKAVAKLEIYCGLDMLSQGSTASGLNVIYARCQHTFCRHFRLQINPQPTSDGNYDVEISSCPCEENHVEKLTRAVSGLERQEVKEKIRHLTTTQYRNDTVKNAPAEFIQNGNLLDIKSRSVLYKIRQEDKEKNDLHKNPIVDVILKRDEAIRCGKNTSILFAGTPLQVVMISSECKDFLQIARKEADKKAGLIIHLDGTGELIKPGNNNEKTVYYYAITCKIGKFTVPLAQFISAEHSTSALKALLEKCFHFLDVRKTRVAQHIVTDCSFAIINAVLETVNIMNLNRYLIVCYELVHSNRPLQENFKRSNMCFIHLCNAHFIKNLVALTKKYYSSHTGSSEARPKNGGPIKVRRDVVEVFCVLIKTHSYVDIKIVIISLFHILLTPKVEASVTQAINTITEHTKNLNHIEVSFMESVILECEVDDGTRSESDVGELLITNDGSPQYRQSPFYKDVKTQFDNISNSTDSIPSENPDNIFYNKPLANFIMKHYVHIIPLWTGVCSPTGITFSNSCAENWFRQTKHDIVGGKTKMRPSHFVEAMDSHVESLHKQIVLEIPTKRLCRGIKRGREVSSSSKRQKKFKASSEISSSEAGSPTSLGFSDDSDLSTVSAMPMSKSSEFLITASNAYNPKIVETWKKRGKKTDKGYMQTLSWLSKEKAGLAVDTASLPEFKTLPTIVEETEQDALGPDVILHLLPTVAPAPIVGSPKQIVGSPPPITFAEELHLSSRSKSSDLVATVSDGYVCKSVKTAKNRVKKTPGRRVKKTSEKRGRRNNKSFMQRLSSKTLPTRVEEHTHSPDRNLTCLTADVVISSVPSDDSLRLTLIRHIQETVIQENGVIGDVFYYYPLIIERQIQAPIAIIQTSLDRPLIIKMKDYECLLDDMHLEKGIMLSMISVFMSKYKVDSQKVVILCSSYSYATELFTINHTDLSITSGVEWIFFIQESGDHGNPFWCLFLLCIKTKKFYYLDHVSENHIVSSQPLHYITENDDPPCPPLYAPTSSTASNEGDLYTLFDAPPCPPLYAPTSSTTSNEGDLYTLFDAPPCPPLYAPTSSTASNEGPNFYTLFDAPPCPPLYAPTSSTTSNEGDLYTLFDAPPCPPLYAPTSSTASNEGPNFYTLFGQSNLHGGLAGHPISKYMGWPSRIMGSHRKNDSRDHLYRFPYAENYAQG